MKETVLSELKIVYLTRKQYQELKDSNAIEENAIYKITDEKQMISVSCNGTVALELSGTIPFNKVMSQIGTGLILDTTNNKITIGKGISKIKISCNVEVASSNRHWFILRHYKSTGVENNKVADIIGIDTSGFMQKSMSPILVNVQEGDYFLMTYSAQNTGGTLNGGISNNHATNLTIEVME